MGIYGDLGKKVIESIIVAIFAIALCAQLVIASINSEMNNEKSNAKEISEKETVGEKAKMVQQEENETGYHDEQVQMMCVFINGHLYAYTSSCIHYDNRSMKDVKEYKEYTYYGDIRIENNVNMPDKDLEASRLRPGTKVYINRKNNKDVLVYYKDTIYFMGIIG